MSLLDIIVLLVLVLTVVRGLMRGMIDTLFSLVDDDDEELAT